MGKRKRRHQSDGPSLEALAGIVIAGTVGYLVIEGLMNDNQHPVHWLLTLAIAGIGFAGGQVVYWWKNVRV